MKKLFLVLTFLLLSYQAQAAGIYDGIWEATSGDYATVTQNGNSIVVIVLAANLLQWDAYQGVLIGSASTVSTVASYGISTLRFIFTSATTADVTLVSCTPTALTVCRFPNGTQFTATKIF